MAYFQFCEVLSLPSTFLFIPAYVTISVHGPLGFLIRATYDQSPIWETRAWTCKVLPSNRAQLEVSSVQFDGAKQNEVLN